MEGVLEKKGGLLGSVWQERWFKLDVANKRLDYFETHHGVKKGQLLLDGSWVKAEPDGVAFTISGPQIKDTYSIRTRTTEERSQWLEAIIGAAYEVKDAAHLASSSSTIGAEARTRSEGTCRQSQEPHHGLRQPCSEDIPRQLTQDEWTHLDTPAPHDVDEFGWSPSAIDAEARTCPQGTCRQSQKAHHGLLQPCTEDMPRQLTQDEWTHLDTPAPHDVDEFGWSPSAIDAEARTCPQGTCRQSQKAHHGLLQLPRQLTQDEWTHLDTPAPHDFYDLVWSPSWAPGGSKDFVLVKQHETANMSRPEEAIQVSGASAAAAIQSDSESSAGGTGAASPTTSVASSEAPFSHGHSGVMRKKGGVLSLSWQERWFRLDPHSKCLYYYTEEGGAEKGCISLEAASLEPDDDGVTFTIQHEERTCLLQCSSADQRSIWISAIRSVARLRGSNHSVGQSSPISVGAEPPEWHDAGPHCSWHCWLCGTEFTAKVRSHQCRSCQRSFCNRCSTQRHVLRHMGPEQHRVCISCHHALLIVEAEELHRTKLLVHQIDKFDELWHLKCWKEEVLQNVS